MPTRIASQLGSYDLLAKTIPGVILFIGVLSLLPGLPKIPDQEVGFGFIIIAIIITVISGYVVGQALHSFSVGVELFTYKLALAVYSNFNYAKVGYWRERGGISSYMSNYDDNQRNIIIRYSSRAFSHLFSFPAILYCWLVSRIREIVLPHRIWFKKRLDEEFSDDGRADGLYEWFKIACREQLRSMDMDLVDQHEKVYRFVMSYLNYVNAGRARKFQATSSFCRSTWITLLGFSILYSVLLYVTPQSIFGYEPVVIGILDQHGMRIPVVLFIGSILFMYSAGQYKKHFIEYIAIDFYNAMGANANSSTISIETDQIDVRVDNQE